MKRSTNKKATIKVVGSLQDFLGQAGKYNEKLEVSFELHPSVKDMIESQGIPHTEVFKIEINSMNVSLDYNLEDGDKIKVYPCEAVDLKDIDPVYTKPTSFIADAHLGKLAKTLRLLGFDTIFDENYDDKDIIHQSNQQKRMILTRDLELLKNGDTKYGYWIRSTDPDRQIEELFERFSISDQINPFTRCMKCNGVLTNVELEEVKEHVPPKVQEWHSIFWRCKNCNQVYWQGSHFEELKEKVKTLTADR